MQTGFAFSKFAARLGSLVELSSEDIDLLAKMPSTIAHFGSHDVILRRGERPSSCSLLLQGYVCWKEPDSREGQITSIYVPGDMPDLYTSQACRLEFNLCTLGTAVVAFVPHSFLHDVVSRSPQLARAFSVLTLADSAALRNWIVNLGSRDALTRVAHLLCEILVRLRAVGQARDYSFPSPFTQSDLACACGISAVHANRIIQELRRNELLTWQGRTISIADWDGLVHLAGFNPDYLRLRKDVGVDPRMPLRTRLPELEASETLLTP